MTSKFNNPAISEQEIVQENISEKSKGFFSKIKDAITSSKPTREKWYDATNVILDEMNKNRFTGHVMGALDNSSNILSNTIKNVKTSDNAREVVGSVGKGASDFTRNILSTFAGGFGKVVAEPVRALADMATNENDAALGNALNKVGNAVDFAGTIVNPVYAMNKTLDTISDVVALGSDIMLAGTDKGVGFKETALDALATTLDFSEPISKAVKEKFSKITDKIKKTDNKNLVENITKRDVSPKASSRAKQDMEKISNLSAKKLTSNIAVSNDGKELVNNLSNNFELSKNNLNNVLENTDPRKVFVDTDKLSNDFNNYLLKNAESSSNVKTESTLVNKLYNELNDVLKNKDATMTQVNNLLNKWSKIGAKSELTEEKDIYLTAINYIQDNYTKEIKDAVDNFRADNTILTTINSLFKKADKKQAAKDLKNLSKTLPDKITDNFHVFILGDQIGVRPTSDAIKDALFGKFFSTKEGDKLFRGLKKSVIDDIPKEKADTIVKRLNDYIKSNNIDLSGIRNPEYNLLKEQYNYNKEEENNQSVLNKNSYNSNKTNYYKTPRPKMSAKELENSLIIPFDF